MIQNIYRTAFVQACLTAAAACTPATHGTDDVPSIPDASIIPDFSDTGPIPRIYDGSTLVDAGDQPELDCGNVVCSAGQRCEDRDDADPECVDNTCEDLNCSDDQRCDNAPDGRGMVCVARCQDDLSCPSDEFCSDGECTPDLCQPGARSCGGADVIECAENGSGTRVRFTCGSETGQSTACMEIDGTATCPCSDDWDCPAHTVCNAGACEGTGEAPTCFVDPLPFPELEPAMEPGFPWGGECEDGVCYDPSNPSLDDVHGSPFPAWSQPVVTPVVANLDDDNGDGLIDERDYPEIIFMAQNPECSGTVYLDNGALRAIHGGGPNRGQDYFATCGSNTWHRDDGDPEQVDCTCAEANLSSTSTVAVGDLDYDGVPEIVVLNENEEQVHIYDNRGSLLVTSPPANFFGNQARGSSGAPALANLDQQGHAEIIVGAAVFTLRSDEEGNLQFQDTFVGNRDSGTNSIGPIGCVANVSSHPGLEIIGGSTVYRMPSAPPGATSRADCTGDEQEADHTAFCAGTLVQVWDGPTVNGGTSERRGFCAVADVLGQDEEAAPSLANPLDGRPEVLVITPRGRLQVYNGETGILRRDIDMQFGTHGGAPNVDDFDGDGFPEIGSAGATAYRVADLQPATESCPAWPTALPGLAGGDNPNLPALTRTPPAGQCDDDVDCGDPDQFACNRQVGQCVCLHNGWHAATQDGSSRRTGSSVFDFNGDGAAEVIYNDECYFRIYDGVAGTVYFEQPNPSRTRSEYPIVADVDNDGNAEIVFSGSNESRHCERFSNGDHSYDDYTENAGIEVWGDPTDTWVAARRIWNQHAYHTTNVTESGAIPVIEPDSWGTYNGRSYNTFRSNPRSYDVAPDLSVNRIQIASPDAACGTLTDRLDIGVRIDNLGDLRVGDATLTFYGEWGGTTAPLYAEDGQSPLQAVVDRIEARQSQVISVSYLAHSNAAGVLPDRIRVVIDESGAARECDETNNELIVDIEPSQPTADLVVALGNLDDSCVQPQIDVTLTNHGSAEVTQALVRFYAGNPSAGGTWFHEELIETSLPPGGSTQTTITLDNMPYRDFVIYGVVDPLNTIEECNDGNNMATVDTPLLCASTVI